MVKKLRYYARFIVVCLLLQRRAHLYELSGQLDKLISNYISIFNPNDAEAWRLVTYEVNQFLKYESPTSISTISHPLVTSTSPARSPLASTPSFRVQEAVLVGGFNDQVKFSELTLDMFRVLQIIEKPSLINPAQEKSSKNTIKTKSGNPHKVLLYKPSLPQLMLYLSLAF